MSRWFPRQFHKDSSSEVDQQAEPTGRRTPPGRGDPSHCRSQKKASRPWQSLFVEVRNPVKDLTFAPRDSSSQRLRDVCFGTQVRSAPYDEMQLEPSRRLGLRRPRATNKTAAACDQLVVSHLFVVRLFGHIFHIANRVAVDEDIRN